MIGIRGTTIFSRIGTVRSVSELLAFGRRLPRAGGPLSETIWLDDADRNMIHDELCRGTFGLAGLRDNRRKLADLEVDGIKVKSYELIPPR